LDRALKGAFFEPLALPPAATGSLNETLADLKKQLAALETSRQQLISSSPGCGTKSARSWCASATAST